MKSLMYAIPFLLLASCAGERSPQGHSFNGPYRGAHLDHIAFPMGGMGAGMICLEGSGALSHVSVRNRPDMDNEPQAFAVLTIRGQQNTARVLEGPVPRWKILAKQQAGNGLGHTTYGLPRFAFATFTARFPYGTVELGDPEVPLEASVTGWSPFIPGKPNNSSLPVAALEYTFRNPGRDTVRAMFSYHSENFMHSAPEGPGDHGQDHIDATNGGFVLVNDKTEEHTEYQGSFAAWVPGEEVTVDHCWFRGGWWDPLTITWQHIAAGHPRDVPPVAGPAPGASIYLPFSLPPGGKKTIRLLLAWHVPCSNLQQGRIPEMAEPCCAEGCETNTYSPWYTSRFPGIRQVTDFWTEHYDGLNETTRSFTRSFYACDLPPEVLEAVSANLTILKSPTVLRLPDGNLWCWEGCSDNSGCCYGSCTHVWNYAQAIPHLFPALERTLRHTEFLVSQDAEGHQTFRSNLPISRPAHDFHAAADGQLGGIMKVYREWRISGDKHWLERIWPAVRQSMDFCIRTWDPRHKGVVEEPHHNTYDIEFWGPDGMCTSFYLGALEAISRMGEALEKDVASYRELFEKGTAFMNGELFNGEYFIQKVATEGLQAPDPLSAARGMWNVNYSPEALEVLKKEGPKYQYGNGCISDGVLGYWLGEMCGLRDFYDSGKVAMHLNSVYRYNLKKDLSRHVNPQRPGFAMGRDGGLLLCTWPGGDIPSLPFVYSNEVWTGIEYQVASHLMVMGEAARGLDIVRTCRRRYDGTARNPFDEYECGHWYARAMASYGLLEGLTGIRFDAVDSTLYIGSGMDGDFTSFLAVQGGFGNVGMKKGKPFVNFCYGSLPVKKCIAGGREMPVTVLP